MSELTIEEAKWIKSVQRAINKCPSSRIGFYTIGDRDIVAYDVTKKDAIDLENGKQDFTGAVIACDAEFGVDLTFNNSVESTAG